MREGIFLSVGLHAGVIAMAVFGMPRLMAPEPLADVPVAVEIVTLPEKPDAKPAPKEPPKAEAPAQSKPVAKAAPPPPPEPPPPPPEAPKVVAVAPPSIPQPPPPEPEPVPPSEPEPVAVERPAPKPRKKPRPPEPPKPVAAAPVEVASAAPSPRHKPKPPPDAFTTLLRNLEQRRQATEQAREVAARERAEAPRLRRPDLPDRSRETEIDRQRIAAQLAQRIRNQVAQCWNLPIGGKDAQKMHVGIRIMLNPDGTLVGRPHIIEQDRMAYDPAFKAFAESAIRALQNPRCSPLRLPLESYETWREISFNFDPRELLN